MANLDKSICFVVAVCKKDYHYAKLCCESIRFFYPDVPIFLAKDGSFSTHQLESLPQVTVLDVPGANVDGMEFTGLLTKLRILYFAEYDRIFFLDADTVLVGPILEALDHSDLFVNGFAANCLDLRSLSDERKRWVAQSFFSPDAIGEFDPAFISQRVLFFISGHFCMRRNIIPTDWVRSSAGKLSPRFHDGSLFKYGDQGFLNYAFNKAAQTGLGTLGYAAFVLFAADAAESDYPQVNAKALEAQAIAGPYLVHFTGPSRRLLYRSHRFGFVLRFYFHRYYSRFPFFTRWIDTLKRVVCDPIAKRLFRKP